MNYFLNTNIDLRRFFWPKASALELSKKSRKIDIFIEEFQELHTESFLEDLIKIESQTLEVRVEKIIDNLDQLGDIRGTLEVFSIPSSSYQYER